MCTTGGEQHNTTQHHTPTVTEMCIRPDVTSYLCQQVEALLFSFVFHLILIKPFLSSFVSFYNRKYGPRISEHHHWCDVSHMGTATCCTASYAGRHFGIALFHLNPNFLTLSTAHKCTKPHLFHFSSDFSGLLNTAQFHFAILQAW